MKFELDFNLENDTFADGNGACETARILREIASKIENDGDFEGVIRDTNGNTIGSCGIFDF